MSLHDSSEDVAKVTEELSHCRTRLDAGVQENKRNRDLIQGLTDQIQKFRERSAHDSARLTSTPSLLATSLPQLSIDMAASSPYIDYYQPPSPLYHSRSRYSRNKSLTRLDLPASSAAQSTSIELRRGYSPQFKSSPRLLHYSDEHLNLDNQQSIDELFARLRNELFKNNTLEEINEMLREENDAALAVNDNLRHDVMELTRALESLEQGQRNDRERFRVENARYRNQAEQQHRQLIELWKAFTAIKRKVRELHTSTASDLDKQLTEFTRCAAVMKKAIRHAEFKNNELRTKMAKEKDEVLEEVMMKYEALSSTQIETDKQLSEKVRLVQRLQDELNRTKDRNEEMESAFARISSMTEISSIPQRPRTRSESPSYLHSVNDTVRRIRSAFSTKSAEVREANSRVEQAEVEVNRLKKQIELHEKEKKSLRDTGKRREEEAAEREQKLLQMGHDIRRLTDRLQAAEEEKTMKETLLSTMQNTLATTHRTHKEFIENLMSNHRDELAARDTKHESDLEERINEERSRLNRMQAEVDRGRTEADSLRQQLRDLRAEHAASLKTSEERESTITSLEEKLSSLKDQLDMELSKLDGKDNEIAEHALRCDELMAKKQQLELELDEQRTSNATLSDENKSLQEQILQFQTEIDQLNEKVESADQSEGELKKRLEETKQLNVTHEQNIQKLKNSVRMLQEKLESDAEETRIVREQLEHHQNLTKEKTDECAEMLKQVEEVKRERDALQDDIASLRNEIATLNGRIVQAEGDAERRRAEDDEKLSIMEDFRVNFDRLTNEGRQKDVQIDDLKEQVKMLQSEIQKKDELTKEERSRYEENLILKEKQLEEDWVSKLRETQDELTRSEKLVKDWEVRVDQLTKMHEKMGDEKQSLSRELAELKERLQETSVKHKVEVEDLVEQNTMDREEWEHERQQLEKSKSAIVADLRANLSKAEAELKEAISRENALQADLNEAKEEIKDLRQRIEKESRAMEEQEAHHREREDSRERNRLAFAAQLEESQVKLVKSAAQLEEASRRRQILEADVAKLEAALSRKSATVKELEEKVDEMAVKLREDEERDQKNKDKMAVLEKENFNLNISRDKVSNKLAEEQRKIVDLEQKLRELTKGIQNAHFKARSDQQRSNEKDGKLHVLTNRIRELEIQLADKTARSDVDSVLVKKMESGGQAIAMELDRQKHTNAELSRQNEELRGTCKVLEEDLVATRAALEKKTTVSKQAMTDLLNNYKDSERKSMERATECEQLKAQLQSFSVKIDRLEKRRADLEARVTESEQRNSELIKKIHQYERSAKMALNVAGSPIALRGGQSIVDISRATGSSGYGDSYSMLRTASSSHDISIRTSPERAVHFTDHDSDKLDISTSMEITLRFLKERIEQLERDKAELTNDLKSQHDELQRSLAKTKETVGSMQALERKVQDLQNENDNLESRLATQRQLYVSNEETMRAKELEYRNLKAKIMSAELHLREKDSKISQMTGQMEALRLEISQMAGDRQRLTSAAKATETEMKTLEDTAHSIRVERDQFAARLTDMNTELKNTQGRLNDVLSELDQTKRLLEDSRRQHQKQKEQLERLMYEERHWKQAAVTAKKTSEDYHKSIYEEKITQLQHNQESLLSRNDALVAEIDRLRGEQRDSANRVNLLNQKLAECERSLESTNQLRNNLSQQVAALQKAEREWSKLEREMRDELVGLRRDKLVLTSEVEELKRKLVRAEVEKKELDGIRARLEREVASLKKHVEALEEEKTRTDAAVRNTLSERKAIDKSLAAMEKENSELYRNCAQLQSQIAQLERDAGSKNVAKLLKDHSEMETRISKLTVEKRQLEMVIEQREMNFTHKRKLLESQLSLLRDQLEAERKRRLELQQRDARTAAGPVASGATPERHYSRVSDVRASRSKSIQRHKSPFRV
ncbi:hypothetical protein V3C99_011440 [Haemonchus contortus]